MTICGLFDPNVALRARNDAINAEVIFRANLDVLDNLAKKYPLGIGAHAVRP